MGRYYGSILLLLALLHIISADVPCQPRDYKWGSVVCVCNATYCDTLDKVGDVKTGKVIIFESNKQGLRFQKKEVSFVPKEEQHEVAINYDATKTYQSIIGFGGAITDSAGINVMALEGNLQDVLIASYYSSKGIEYNIGRVPMASCDFSTRQYSYADVENDFNLTHFKLAEEDIKYKIPIIKKAKEMSPDLLLFGSPWSSPAWMKTNEKMTGSGTLKGKLGGKYYQTWANYFVKFLQAYESQNISFWGLTVNNEPLNCFIFNFGFQCLGMTDYMQREFIVQNLGPVLASEGYPPEKIKLMILDDQRFELPRWAKTVFKDPEAEKYVSGIGLHWYWNWMAPASLLDKTHNLFPDKFILATEACVSGLKKHGQAVLLGNWENGESYAKDIIEDINHWTTGWVDWNLALDLEGGPNWVSNFVDSPIIVNKTAQEFYKQPMFYAMGHFSKFVKPGSLRIDLNVTDNEWLDSVAFLTPNKEIVLVLLNSGTNDVQVEVQDEKQGNFNFTSTKKSIQTLIWAHDK